MSISDIRSLVKKIYSENSTASARNIVRKYKDDILKEFNYKYSLKICISMIQSDEYQAPKCSCGKECHNDGNVWKKTCGDNDCFRKLQKENNFQNSDKLKKTNLERYGVESFTSSQKFKDLASKTNAERYGSSVYVKSPDFQKKRKDSSLEKYGVDHHMKSDLIRMKPSQTKRSLFEETYPEFSYDNLSKLCNESTTVMEVCKVIYGNVFIDDMMFNRVYSLITNRELPYLKSCGVSNGEKEVAEYIQTFYSGKIEINTRTVLSSGKELDIFIPEFNLAIEYNGEYWHSEKIHKNKHNLLDKTIECEEQGIHVLHIYDSEWRDATKRMIWMSMIRHKMGLTQNRIYARRCDITENTDTAFFDKHHIQGNSNGSILTVALTFNDEIVAQISVSKSRFNKKFDYEILRFAVKRDTHVVGGFAKLFKYVKSKLSSTSFISYANRRWSQGNVYTSSGEFIYLGNSKPNYMYHKQGKTISRINAQKHKLSSFLNSFDPSKSETSNMLDNGYVMVYDCGNLSFSSV